MNDDIINLLSEIFANVLIEHSGLVQDQQCQDQRRLDGLSADVDLDICSYFLSE
jgi:hypothetical protein